MKKHVSLHIGHEKRDQLSWQVLENLVDVHSSWYGNWIYFPASQEHLVIPVKRKWKDMNMPYNTFAIHYIVNGCKQILTWDLKAVYLLFLPFGCWGDGYYPWLSQKYGRSHKLLDAMVLFWLWSDSVSTRRRIQFLERPATSKRFLPQKSATNHRTLFQFQVHLGRQNTPNWPSSSPVGSVRKAGGVPRLNLPRLRFSVSWLRHQGIKGR